MDCIATETSSTESLPDEEVVRRVLEGETGLFELVMRRYNQRLYRVARAILRDNAEAEDVMQDAYVRAYEHLSQFAGRSQFATWLTRIAIHEALARVQRRKRVDQLGAREWSEGEGEANVAVVRTGWGRSTVSVWVHGSALRPGGGEGDGQDCCRPNSPLTTGKCSLLFRARMFLHSAPRLVFGVANVLQQAIGALGRTSYA